MNDELRGLLKAAVLVAVCALVAYLAYDVGYSDGVIETNDRIYDADICGDKK